MSRNGRNAISPIYRHSWEKRQNNDFCDRPTDRQLLLYINRHCPHHSHCHRNGDHNQGDLEREVNELEERATEAGKLTEPRENSYIEFRVRMIMPLMMIIMLYG